MEPPTNRQQLVSRSKWEKCSNIFSSLPASEALRSSSRFLQVELELPLQVIKEQQFADFHSLLHRWGDEAVI